jgi:hypothetical protein
MSLDINLTGVEKTSNKKTTLTDNSDTFYPTQKAVKTAVDSKFNTPTGTTAQYLRGDGSLDTFPTIPDVTGLQSKAVVVSTNQTAVNDGSYTVVSNATFTDPSPVEGKGYRVFVRNGTATINSVAYTVGTSILRLFHSGAWVSYVSLPDSNFVPYTGATGNVDLGNNDLNASKGTFNHNGSTDTLTATHSSGSGIGLLITKGGSNEGLKVNKTSGSGNAATIIGTLEATTLVKTGGTSAEFLMADGSVSTSMNPRVQTVSSSATVTATSTNDLVTITAQAVGLTLANPTGAFAEGQSLIIRIKDNGTARTIGYGANFRAIGVTAPTTTVSNKTTYIGCIYNSTDTKFDIIGVCTEA